MPHCDECTCTNVRVGEGVTKTLYMYNIRCSLKNSCNGILIFVNFQRL